MTRDTNILNLVKGMSIDFVCTPHQTYPPVWSVNQNEHDIIENAIQELLQKGVIVESPAESGQFISTIFTRPKKNGKVRVILNLKSLNEFVAYHHFKMDTLQSCINMMKPDSYMASIDLRDAYYTVPIAPQYTKFLKFVWNQKLYAFTCLPNGLSSGPRLFTKLMKPVLVSLRQKGHSVSGYLDDCFLTNEDYDACRNSVLHSIDLLESLGFIVHYDKSVLTPTKQLEHLGFILNSQSMTVRPNREKVEKLIDYAEFVLHNSLVKIRDVATLIGLMVSCFPGVQYGQLFYRHLEIEKSEALKRCKGNFECDMTLTIQAKSDIDWWLKNLPTSFKPISRPAPICKLTTDASLDGWGATRDMTQATGGRWKAIEMFDNNINALELQAVLFGLQSLCFDLSNAHILVQSDNATTVSYVKHMGGSHSAVCNELARRVWHWCMERNLWLTITHIPGRLNELADKQSRVFDDKTEWKLNVDVYRHVTQVYGEPSIDLFASRLNHQLHPYAAWRPDPQACAVDAFSLTWNNYDLCYIFCPFSVIPIMLKKVREERAEAIVILPRWPTQAWYTSLQAMLVEPPLHLGKRTDLLSLPFRPGLVHPLLKKLNLMACRLSGKACRTGRYQIEHCK